MLPIAPETADGVALNQLFIRPLFAPIPQLSANAGAAENNTLPSAIDVLIPIPTLDTLTVRPRHTETAQDSV